MQKVQTEKKRGNWERQDLNRGVIPSNKRNLRKVRNIFQRKGCRFCCSKFDTLLLFYSFCKFNSILGTNKVVVVVVVELMVSVSQM